MLLLNITSSKVRNNFIRCAHYFYSSGTVNIQYSFRRSKNAKIMGANYVATSKSANRKSAKLDGFTVVSELVENCYVLHGIVAAAMSTISDARMNTCLALVEH
jgi:hypothetical protein